MSHIKDNSKRKERVLNISSDKDSLTHSPAVKRRKANESVSEDDDIFESPNMAEGVAESLKLIHQRLEKLDNSVETLINKTLQRVEAVQTEAVNNFTLKVESLECKSLVVDKAYWRITSERQFRFKH